MPRHKLEFDLPETDFLLFGICSQSKDYRLVWIINKNLGLYLKRENDIISDISNHFARFIFENSSAGIKYYLFSNKQNGNLLLRELKQMDYLLVIEGNYSAVDPEVFLSELKRSESVLAAYGLSPDTIKSKQHLILG